MKKKDVMRLLNENDFVLIRQSGHEIWANGTQRVILSRDADVSPGVMRKIHKSIKNAKNENNINN